MAKKRPMTSAERVRKHRAEKKAKRQVNLTLHSQTITKLDKKAKQSDQTRSELIDTLIASVVKTKKAAVPHSQPVAEGISVEDQQAVLHVLNHIDSTYLQQIAVDGLDPRQMRRAITRMTKALQTQNPALSASRRKKVTSNKKKKSTAKKKATPQAVGKA